jgi:hypothetical protein
MLDYATPDWHAGPAGSRFLELLYACSLPCCPASQVTTTVLSPKPSAS